MGEAACQLLVDQSLVSTPADLYRLAPEQLIGLPGFARKKAEKVVGAIQDSKKRELSRLLFGLGLPGIGEKAAKLLAQRFGSLEAVENAGWEEIAQIDGFGEIMARSVQDYFREEHNRNLCRELQELGLNTTQARPEASGELEGLTFVLTGTLPTLTRSELRAGRGGRGEQAHQGQPAGDPGDRRGGPFENGKRRNRALNIDIRHIAKLARLTIEEDRMEKFEKDMADIVAMVEKLPAVENQSLALDPADRMELRRDEIKPSLRREAVLQNAPKTAAGCIVVPKTVD